MCAVDGGYDDAGDNDVSGDIDNDVNDDGGDCDICLVVCIQSLKKLSKYRPFSSNRQIYFRIL